MRHLLLLLCDLHQMMWTGHLVWMEDGQLHKEAEATGKGENCH